MASRSIHAVKNGKKKLFFKNNGWNFLKSKEENWYLDSKSPKFSNKKKPKSPHETHCNQSFKIRQNFAQPLKSALPWIMETPQDSQQISQKKLGRSERNKRIYSKCWKSLPTKNIIPGKLSFKNGSKIKNFPDKQELRESSSVRLARPDVQEILKRIF